MNPSKSRCMVFSLKHDKRIHPALILDGVHIKEVESRTYLELTFQVNMSWRSHIQNVFEKSIEKIKHVKITKIQG